MSDQTTPELIATAERRAFVLAFRKSGASYKDIADATLKKFGAARLPAGWDERYAYKDVARELERLHRETSESAAEVVLLELARLDTAMMAIWNFVKSGHLGSIDRMLRIMERRARYTGLDSPEKVEAILTGAGGGPIEHKAAGGDGEIGEATARTITDILVAIGAIRIDGGDRDGSADLPLVPPGPDA